MTDEMKNDATPNGAEKQASEGSVKSDGLKKFLLPGAIGVGAIVITVVAVMMFAGDKPAEDQATDTASETEVAEKPTTGHESEATYSTDEKHQPSSESHATEVSDQELAAEEMENLDFLIDESDQSVMEQITASLEFLDYDPSMELEGMESEGNSGMSKEDSIDAAKWLENEKVALAEREKALVVREKELEKQHQEIQRKILIIEQAESNRISKLAKLYDGMDARSVTKLMANLDDATVVSVISRMKQKQASAVLALISPKRAAKLSKMMITIAEN